jgi:hypothetical protein
VLHELTWTTALKALSGRAPRSSRSTFGDFGRQCNVDDPVTRVESRREHRVPLSALAVGLLKELYTEAGNPCLFIGPKKGATLSVTALVGALRRVGRHQTAHESWATFVTTASVEERKGDVVPMRGR